MRKLTVLTLLLVLGLSVTTLAAVPRLINYQGRLTDAGDTPLEGSFDITFRIYDAQSGGNLLWEETQSVLLQKGVFSILLGGTRDLDLAFDQPYWLAIKVGADSEMSPRQQIASSGYAIRAEQADSAVNAQTADMADDTQKIAGKSFDAPSASDNGKILTYNHSGSKFEYTTYVKMRTGTYTGNGSDPQTVTHNLGRIPLLILLMADGASPNSHGIWISGNSRIVLFNTSNSFPTTVTSTTFTVRGTDFNVNGRVYRYIVI